MFVRRFEVVFRWFQDGFRVFFSVRVVDGCCMVLGLVGGGFMSDSSGFMCCFRLFFMDGTRCSVVLVVSNS